jgi:hypothetical protein
MKKNISPTDLDIYNAYERNTKIAFIVLVLIMGAFDYSLSGYRVELANCLILAAIWQAVENLKLYIYCRFNESKKEV